MTQRKPSLVDCEVIVVFAKDCHGRDESTAAYVCSFLIGCQLRQGTIVCRKPWERTRPPIMACTIQQHY